MTDPISVSSFSIFCWIYNPFTWFDGVFQYSSTDSEDAAEINLSTGWHKQVGQAQIHLKNARYPNNVEWSPDKWIYIGVVFSAKNGNFSDFYSCKALWTMQ